MHIYSSEQHHHSIIDFVDHYLHHSDDNQGLLLQVTTHGHILPREELNALKRIDVHGNLRVESLLLEEFDTELDFSNRVEPIFHRNEGDSHTCLIVIQCESGHINGDLIACARYRIYDERLKALKRNKIHETCGVTHVLFIIILPHQVLSSTKFVGFQGDPWISAHIDDLRPTTEDTVEPLQALSSTISELFIGEYIQDIEPYPVSTLETTLLEEPRSELNTLLSHEKIYEEDVTVDEKESEHEDFTSYDHKIEPATQKQSSLSSSTVSLSPVEQISVVMVPTSLGFESLSGNLKENSENNGTVHKPGSGSSLDNSSMVTPLSMRSDIPQKQVEEYAESPEDLPIIPFELFADQQDTFLHEEESLVQTQPTSSSISLTEESNFQTSARAIDDIKVAHKSEMKSSAQCKQLYAYIQAAASMLEDSRSTQRITYLTKLIPRNSSEHMDLNNFYGILVKHIYDVLKDMEADRPYLSNWVLREALNSRNIEVGRTFRNVLVHKIKEVVVPIFAMIIALVDRYYNLNLITQKGVDSTLSQFWLSMFRSSQVQQFKFSDTVGGKILGSGKRKLENEFQCQLPFFWLVKDAVDSYWDAAKSYAGLANQTHFDQLCRCVYDSPVGVVLNSVAPENFEDFYKRYLHDFVKSVHQCNQKYTEQVHADMELSLVSKALDHVVHCSEFQHQSLTSMIVAIHIAYGTNQSRIFWFSQLVTHSPGILQSLLAKFPKTDSLEVEIHLYAAERMIEKLEPPLHKDSPNKNLVQWLNHVRLSQNTIQTILELKSQSEHFIKARHGWNRLHATRLFVEHVMMKHLDVDLKILARRLCGRWRGKCDFLKASTVKGLQLQLGGVENLLKKEAKCNDHDKIKEVKNSCRVFFMEVVSQLCFKGQAVPETPLVKMLMDTVFKAEDTAQTQELTPYRDDRADVIPTIRSFLLQLLLEHSIDQVKEHLSDYLNRSYHVLTRDQIPHSEQNLCLLIIQCFEDALTKKMYLRTNTRVEETIEIVIEGHKALQVHQCAIPTLEYLEGIAKVRYCLSVFAELLKHNVKGQAFENLSTAVEQLCSDCELNSINSTGCRNILGPVVYLLKLLGRRYGIPFLKTAFERYEWIIPAELRSDNNKILDPFVIYKQLYVSLRRAVNEVMYGNQIEVLTESTKNLMSHEVVNFILAIFVKATLSRAESSSANRISSDALEKLDGFIMKYSLLSNELQLMARALLANQQGGRVLEQMSVSPQQPLHCRTLMGVVIHAVAVFFSRHDVDMLSPFVNMLSNPAILNQSYLPTMQEDPLVESKEAMLERDENGKFYECPNGHKYFVGDCGGTYSTGVCSECTAPIGGTSGQPVEGNKFTNTQDSTNKGHDLGSPDKRVIINPERNLSARAVCIVRALMHSAFIWASCNTDMAIEAIKSMVIPRIPPQHLPEFFWAHLEKDVELLSRDTGRGLDDTVMVLHLVLQQILTNKPPTGGDIQKISSLESKEARKKWERIFSEHYIHPVLSTLDGRLKGAMDYIAQDDQQDHDQLFYLVYEKVKYNEESLEPHLWTYRSRITLEHLRQTLQEKEMSDEHPILYEFLQAEVELRATQYLPDITRLQWCLHDQFNHQVDKGIVQRQTIKEFVMELPNGTTKKSSYAQSIVEATKNDYQEMIDSIKAAWGLVGHKLKNYSRIPVEEKYFIAQIDDDTPMEYLVPTTSEAGVCTTALVDFLTLTHNNFIERCRALVAEKDQRSLNFWREHKVPITHLHRCHLLDFKHQLPSIILSHCHYSLKVGKGQDVKYDHQALEKHILNRFIHGKPLIFRKNIPHVVYKKTVYTIDTFANVRKNVKPQPRMQQDIIAELHTPDRLHEALEIVEMVLRYLSSGGGKAADKSLGEYMDKTLRLNEVQFSKKMKSSCQLKHALSIWETIAVELARQLCLRGQEPFESIPKNFLCELSKNDDQIATLDRCLGQFDPDLLLGTLYEFIRTYITHCPPHECDQPLRDVLKVVLELHGKELPHLGEFPASIKLDQAVATWKHVVHYYNKKN